MTLFDYGVFGLRLRSERAIPGLSANASETADRPDVTVGWGPVARPEDPAEIEPEVFAGLAGADLVIHVPGVAAYAVRGDSQVVVDPEPGVADEDAEAYLLGTVMAALLYRRRLVPLHSNGVVLGDAAFLVCGQSGAGKSTAAARFQAMGLPLLSDDLSALAAGSGDDVLALPGIRRLKLWSDAIERFGLAGRPSRPIPWSDGRKVEIAATTSAGDGPYRIGAVFQLEWSPDAGTASVDRASGAEAVAVIAANLHRRRLADLAGQTGLYMDIAGRIARKTPVFRVRRGVDPQDADRAIGRVIDRMRELAADRPAVAVQDPP